MLQEPCFNLTRVSLPDLDDCGWANWSGVAILLAGLGDVPALSVNALLVARLL